MLDNNLSINENGLNSDNDDCEPSEKIYFSIE